MASEQKSKSPSLKVPHNTPTREEPKYVILQESSHEYG